MCLLIRLITKAIYRVSVDLNLILHIKDPKMQCIQFLLFVFGSPFSKADFKKKHDFQNSWPALYHRYDDANPHAQASHETWRKPTFGSASGCTPSARSLALRDRSLARDIENTHTPVRPRTKKKRACALRALGPWRLPPWHPVSLVR